MPRAPLGVAPGETAEEARLYDGRVRRARVSGNGTDPACGDLTACADIATCNNAPRLTGGTTCETSYVLGSGLPGMSFGICSQD